MKICHNQLLLTRFRDIGLKLNVEENWLIQFNDLIQYSSMIHDPQQYESTSFYYYPSRKRNGLKGVFSLPLPNYPNVLVQSIKKFSIKLAVTLFSWNILIKWICVWVFHCTVEIVSIQIFCGPYFSAFGLNTKNYRANLLIRSEWGEIQTRKTPNTDTFYVVLHFERK